MRKTTTHKFTIADGQTAAAETAAVGGVAFGGIHVSEGLDGLTLSFYDSGDWGRDLVLEKVVETGFNPFSDTEARAIGPSQLIDIEASAGVSGAQTAWLKLKD